jgi:hypothetical protein
LSVRSRRIRRQILALAALAVSALGLTVGLDGAPAAARTAARNSLFNRPYYYPSVNGDTYFNTVAPDGGILATADDTHGANNGCAIARDIAIVSMKGSSPDHLQASTVNCMISFGVRGGGRSPDGCSWKTGGITRVGNVVYLAVARQLRRCSAGRSAHGLQPSFDASIIASTDGGHTWTNPWGVTGRQGSAPAWNPKAHRYRAMFAGQQFSAPFFIQYGPGNTHTADGADKYLYAVSNDGYAYNGNYLHLARVPINRALHRTAWRYYHGKIGGGGASWTTRNAGATRVLQVRRGLSQPSIQYLPAFHRYLLTTFTYSRARSDFPNRTQTPFTRVRFYTAPHPWGPWTRKLDVGARRDIWCRRACSLTREPGDAVVNVGRPSDWLGFYDPCLVQKFVFSRALRSQAILTSGDFRNQTRYRRENLYRLHAIPFDLAALIRG